MTIITDLLIIVHFISVCLFLYHIYPSYSDTSTLYHTLPASVAQLDAPSDWKPGGRGFNPRRGWQHSFVEIDHEIFSTVILSLTLIQEGQLSVSGERMCTIQCSSNISRYCGSITLKLPCGRSAI